MKKKKIDRSTIIYKTPPIHSLGIKSRTYELRGMTQEEYKELMKHISNKK